jgi:hypothetical protein
MMNAIRIRAVIALALGGCGPALTPAGQQVHVVAVRPFGCTELGTLRGPGDSVDHSAPEDPSHGWHEAMRNDAAEKGANYVWIVGSDTLGTTAEARAFHCDAAPTLPPKLGAKTPDAEPTAEERLKKLKDLFDKGVITKEEYDEKRAAILRSL